MKVLRLRTIIAHVIATAVPLAGISTVGVNVACENCSGEEGRRYSTEMRPRPVLDDAGFEIDASADGGLAGPDAGLDCSRACVVEFSPHQTLDSCEPGVSDAGSPIVRCNWIEHESCLPYGAVEGRRPAGLEHHPIARRGSPLGALFAEMAHLEAASIPAFARLRAELRSFGAPAHLVREAARAARDEVRHARVMTKLAHEHGGETAKPRIAKPGPRSLEEIAIENEIEGCVRETYGAIVASWQAQTARDPKVRRAMKTIAADEARHAALAWRVAAWARDQLGTDAHERIAAARVTAIATLRAELEQPMPPIAVERAGMPQTSNALALVDAATSVIWSCLALAEVQGRRMFRLINPL